MNISERSWHYRFMYWMRVWPEYRTDLCSYMRGLVFAFIKGAFFLSGGAFLIGGGLGVVWCMLYSLSGLFFNIDTTSFAWILGTAVWFFVCLSGAVYVIQEMLDRRVHKPAGPIKQYLKDRHNKVCRLISFTE